MEARLAEVWGCLRKAVKSKRQQEKRVHALRVATRRAGAACELFEEFLPQGRARWLRKQLASLRRAAGDVRDLDVLADRIEDELFDASAEEVLHQLRKRRAIAVRPIAKLRRHLARGHRFKRRSEKLYRWILKHAKRNSKDLRFGDWAQERLASLVTAFFQAEPGGGWNRKEWHAFRIQGKALRYSLELLAGTLPPQIESEILPLAIELQDRLGAINDLATADKRLRKSLHALPSDALETLARLATDHQSQLAQAKREFDAWYSETARATLRDGLDRCVSANVKLADVSCSTT